MKKFGKLMFTGLLIGGLLVPVAGCVKAPDPFIPPESSDKVIINDAYDWNDDETASTRPELGGGYVPAPPAKDALITIAEGSVIRFKDGQSSFKLPVGELLTNAHFDEASLNGHNIGGVAVLDEQGNIAEVFALKNFTPTEETTVLPFYSLDKGEDGLFGATAVGDWIHDADFNDLSESVEIKNAISVVNGWLSNNINIAGTFASGSSFRALTPYTVKEGYDYTYSYKFTNNGNSAVSFDVYQMREGYRWDNTVTSVPVETITLQAGESSEIVSVKLENNSANQNVMTVIKVNDDVENLSLGVAFAAEDSTVFGPATVKVRLPEGVTIEEGGYVKVDSGYEMEVNSLDNLVLPVIKESGAMGKAPLGWFDTATGKVVDETTTIIRSMTIAPYWQQVNGYDGRIDIGSGKAEGYNDDECPGDIGKHLAANTGSVSYKGNVNAQKDKGVVVNGGNGYSVLGSVFSDSLPVQAGSAIRFDSKRTAGAGIYEFCYTVENRGSSRLHLSIYQINASSDYKKGGNYYRYEEQRYRTSVELNPGESKVVKGQYDFTGQTNGNWLTYVVFEEDVDSFSFGLAASYNSVDAYDNETYPKGNKLDKNVTISYDEQANGGIKVAESYLKDRRVGRFIVAPSNNEVTIPEDVIFLGWQLVIKGKTYDLPANRNDWTDLQIPSSGATLKAKYSKVTNTPLQITAVQIEGFELSQDYLSKEIFVGGYFVVPAEGEYTNTTGLPIVGWRDANTGKELTNDTLVDVESIVLEPVFAETVTVTLQLPEGMTVGDTFKTQQAKNTKLVLPSEEDITATPENMGAPAGWYNVATKAIVTADTVLSGDITIAPYWNTFNGYTAVQVGSGANYGYNAQEVPGDLMKYAAANNGTGLQYYGYNTGGASSKNGDAKILNVGDYALLGSVLSANKPVQAGSAIRFDSKRTLNTTGNYEYSYTIVNNGTTDIWLSIYQINASSEYRSPSYYGYESRYRTEIKVAAGKAVTAKGQYYLEANGGNNMMTYIVFEKDVESFSFGISVGYKLIDAIGDEYKNQPAIENNVKLTYNPAENDGITVKDSYLNYKVGKFAVAPKAEDLVVPEGVGVTKWQIVINGTAYDLPASTQSYTNAMIPSSGATLKAVLAKPVTITWLDNNGVSVAGGKTSVITQNKLEDIPELTETTTDGRKHLGWFDTATGEVVTAETIVTKEMTIAPYFEHAADNGTALTPLSGGKSTEDGCPYGPDTLSSTSLKGNFSKITDAVSGDEKGIVLKYNGNLAANDAFRFKTTYNVQAKTYKFTYTFTNYSEDEIKFTVYQVKSGKETSGAPKQEITLAAGATITAELEITFEATNGNALTYFVMNGAISDMALGVAMSVTEVTA